MSASQVTKHGLILDFLSSFSGQVDFLHMEPDQASSYTEGDEVCDETVTVMNGMLMDVVY